MGREARAGGRPSSSSRPCRSCAFRPKKKKKNSPVDRHDQPGRLGPVHGSQRRQQPGPLRRPGLDALLGVELDKLRRSLGGRVPKKRDFFGFSSFGFFF